MRYVITIDVDEDSLRQFVESNESEWHERGIMLQDEVRASLEYEGIVVTHMDALEDAQLTSTD